MKKIILLAYLALVLLLSFSGQLPIHLASLLTPRAAPCATFDSFHTVRVQQATVTIFCGVDQRQQDNVLPLVDVALRAMPPGIVRTAQVFLFSDLDDGLRSEYRLLKQEGFSPSLDELRSDWTADSFLGQAFKGGVFLYVGNPAWSHDSFGIARLTVLHEMHHLLQFELLNSNRRLPLWLSEGAADDVAESELAGLKLQVPTRSTSSFHCDYSLSQLEEEQDDVPLACAYLEGQPAAHLLLQQGDQASYYRLLQEVGQGTSFADAFQRAYGFRLADFYGLFNGFRQSGYLIPPALPLPMGIALP